MKDDIRHYDHEDIKAIRRERAERARLCDPARLAHDLKALARIRRDMQRVQADRAVAMERARKVDVA